jgi:hypothetical protein
MWASLKHSSTVNTKARATVRVDKYSIFHVFELCLYVMLLEVVENAKTKQQEN